LISLGFAVRDVPFTYASWPGRWGTPTAGIAWIVTALIAGRSPAASLTVLIAGALVIALGARWLQRDGVTRGKTPGVNLEAKRGEPAIWLVAHLDSKSQPIPILVRAAAIVACIIAWIVLVVLSALRVEGLAWQIATLAAVLAGLPVAISTVGAKSPGALDNATGVAAVLLAAERVDRSVPLGVLITSAEELGLAGARAWVRQQPSKAAVINCDTIDDHGYLTIMHSHGRPERLIRAFERRAVRVRRVLPGILVDSIAFAEAGWDAVTVSRGTLATLARVHRPIDTPEALNGSGVAGAADVIAEALVNV
jgi:Iap family predicted aminopeptidase